MRKYVSLSHSHYEWLCENHQMFGYVASLLERNITTEGVQLSTSGDALGGNMVDILLEIITLGWC